MTGLKRRSKRYFNCVISEAPGWIFIRAKPVALPRYALNARRALGAVCLIHRECRVMVAVPVQFETTLEDDGVFDSHRSTLCHMRLHRMAGISQQYDATAAP